MIDMSQDDQRQYYDQQNIPQNYRQGQGNAQYEQPPQYACQGPPQYAQYTDQQPPHYSRQGPQYAQYADQQAPQYSRQGQYSQYEEEHQPIQNQFGAMTIANHPQAVANLIRPTPARYLRKPSKDTIRVTNSTSWAYITVHLGLDENTTMVMQEASGFGQ